MIIPEVISLQKIMAVEVCYLGFQCNKRKGLGLILDRIKSIGGLIFKRVERAVLGCLIEILRNLNPNIIGMRRYAPLSSKHLAI